MLEILVVMAAIAIGIGAAHVKRRRKRARMVYLPFDVNLVLSTLADNGVSVTGLQTLAQDFDIYGLRASVTITDATAGEGPMEIGWADNRLSSGQILEQRDAAPTSQWQIPAVEHAARKVRVFGTSSGESNDSLNDGKVIWKKMYLKVPAGLPLADLWAINRSGAQLTTGQIVNFHGSVVGQWK